MVKSILSMVSRSGAGAVAISVCLVFAGCSGGGSSGGSSAPGSPAFAIVTSTLPGGTIGASYSETVTAVGGVGALTWTVSGGPLPDGLALSPGTGAISGIPTAQGVFNFTLQVKDSASPTPHSATQALSITISQVPLSITSLSPLPAGEVGKAYSYTLTASGGIPGYTWSLLAGTLPAGLSLDSAGLISGTPSGQETQSITVKVTDSLGGIATTLLTITINPIGGAPLTITTSSPLPIGLVGTSYNVSLAASGGTGALLWTVASGLLPDGVTLNPSTGVISGTPTAESLDPVTFDIQVADSASHTTKKQFSIAIYTFAGGGTLTLASAPSSMGGTFVAEGGIIFPPLGGDGMVQWSEAVSGTHAETVRVRFDAASKISDIHVFLTDSGVSAAWACSACSGAIADRINGTLTLAGVVVKVPFGVNPDMTLTGTLTFTPF